MNCESNSHGVKGKCLLVMDLWVSPMNTRMLGCSVRGFGSVRNRLQGYSLLDNRYTVEIGSVTRSLSLKALSVGTKPLETPSLSSFRTRQTLALEIP